MSKLFSGKKNLTINIFQSDLIELCQNLCNFVLKTAFSKFAKSILKSILTGLPWESDANCFWRNFFPILWNCWKNHASDWFHKKKICALDFWFFHYIVKTPRRPHNKDTWVSLLLGHLSVLILRTSSSDKWHLDVLILRTLRCPYYKDVLIIWTPKCPHF